jgi:PPE family
MIDEADGAPRWAAYSHEEILAMVRAGPGPAASQAAAGRWDGTWAAVSAIEAELARAVAEAGSGWAGLAADAMTAGATPLGQWAGEAAAQARATAQTVDAQARYAEYTRREMPPLAHPEIPTEPFRGPRPYMSRVPIMTDWAAVERDRDAAAARARDLMATYSRNSYETLPGLLESHGPPSVVVQNTATGTLHGPGITPAMESLGVPPAAAGAATGPAAAGSLHLPGAGGAGLVPGLGGAVATGSSGPALRGGRPSLPGAGGIGSAGSAQAGPPPSGAGPGGATGPAAPGAGGIVSALPRRGAGGLPGQVGVGSDVRSRGPTGPGLPGGSAGIGSPARGGLLPGEPGAGPGSRGTTGSLLGDPVPRAPAGAGLPLDAWTDRPLPRGPVIDAWAEGRPGAVAGRVAASPLPPPVVLDRGSPERPFPSSAPPSGRAFGEGLLPLGAGAMGRSGDGEHQRPHYLVDDGSAFADDRPIPGPVINEGWPRD